MALGILTSKLQVIKTLKEHEYIQRLKDHDYLQSIHDATKRITDGIVMAEYYQTDQRKTRAQLIRLSAAVCGIELCYAAETAFVSPVLLKLGVPVHFMTLVWCLSPLLGLILVPVMGSLSDRCSLKLGRRRPFILLFSAGIVIGLVLVPNGEALGILAGDSSELLPDGGRNATDEYLNTTDNYVTFENGTSVLRTDITPEWPSVKLPNRHVVGILLTVLGVALLDFNCDACQSPCRTYLLDISVPEDHSRGLTSFTVMAGLGGSFGYMVGGIDWESTSFGTALGGHIRVVFTGVLILFIICVILTVTSFRETPLKELGGQIAENLQRKVKKVKKAKYKKFVNESSEEESDATESEHVKETVASYGAVRDLNANGLKANGVKANGVHGNGTFPAEFDSHVHDIKAENGVKKPDYDPESQLKETTTNVSSDISALVQEIPLKAYLKSIIKMPRSLQILCLTNLFCWMSLVSYSLYFTDFVGQAVFGGDPRAPAGSYKHQLYDAGVRLGSFGMSLYSLSCALYSMTVEYLVNKFSKCIVPLS